MVLEKKLADDCYCLGSVGMGETTPRDRVIYWVVLMTTPRYPRFESGLGTARRFASGFLGN